MAGLLETAPHTPTADTPAAPPPESDESLAGRAAMDAEAFAELYRRHVMAIRRYCGFRLRDRLMVEDAASDIFVKVLEGLHVSRVERFRPWLFTIAHHEVADRYRRQRAEVGLEAADQLASRAPSPEHAAVASSELEALYAAIGQLKPDQARVVELRLAGLDGPEIRQVLNRSRSWVDTTQYRALLRLRELMATDQSRETKR